MAQFSTIRDGHEPVTQDGDLRFDFAAFEQWRHVFVAGVACGPLGEGGEDEKAVADQKARVSLPGRDAVAEGDGRVFVAYYHPAALRFCCRDLALRYAG